MENDKKLSPAFLAAHDIRAMKRDYGGIKDYFPFGAKSYIQMIHVKTKRLVNIANLTEAEIKNESVKDNLLDLINYASYMYEYLEGVLDE